MEFEENSQQLATTERLERRSLTLVWTGFFFAFLQSVCALFLAASGVRFVAGIGALVFAAATSGPVLAFHRELFRLPMLLFSIVASCINLALLWQVRWLRARPAARWRMQPVSAHRRRMESLQLWLSVATLFLVGLEMVLHRHYHGFYLFGLWPD